MPAFWYLQKVRLEGDDPSGEKAVRVPSHVLGEQRNILRITKVFR